MKIALITPVYPSKNAPRGTTPVVHYFTREWVKMGHSVTVFNLETKYPFYFYWVTKLFESKLNSKLGHLISTKSPIEYEEKNEGVKVYHMVMKKFLPTPRFHKSEILKTCNRIQLICDKVGIPDVFIGHWDSPQLEIMYLMRNKYPNVKNALVLHSLNRDLNKTYLHDLDRLFGSIDVIGFRSFVAMNMFKKQYFSPQASFIASSGINNLFLNNAEVKNFNQGIRNFIFVGSLIQRKHPLEIISALTAVYGEDSYSITYVGEGKEDTAIRKNFAKLNKNGQLKLTGRIERSSVIDYLKKSDVFVMISDNETFGLVYLEAMALGCVTIASKGGGIDGIIIDGENGFLCNPGDANDLSRIIDKLRKYDKEELRLISEKAVHTAKMYTDEKVAETYLNAIFK